MNSLTTAIITTYKREPSVLRRAIESVVRQTYLPLELIVINDAPEEGELSKELERVCDLAKTQYGDIPITYIVLQEHMGACYARNVGLSRAKGKYIAFLDDDDEWMSEKNEKQLEGFIDETIGMVYSPFINVDYRKKKSERIVMRSTKSGNLLDDIVEFNIIGGMSMVTFRTAALRDVGGLDINLLANQDYDLWIRMARKYPIQCIPIPLTIRHYLKVSITSNIKRKEQGFLYFQEKHKELYENNRKAMQNRIRMIVHDAIKFGDRAFADKILHDYRNYKSFDMMCYYWRCRVEKVAESILASIGVLK